MFLIHKLKKPHILENFRLILGIRYNDRNALILLFKMLISINDFRKYDIIHINYASFFPLAFLARILWNIPYIYVCHGCPQPEYERGLSRILYSFEDFSVAIISRGASECVNISTYGKNLLYDRHRVISHVIYHGIDSDSFNDGDKKMRSDIRNSLGVSPSQYLVLFVGRFSKYKNILTLIDSIYEITQIRNDVKFLLIGDGELYNDALDKINHYHINNYVLIKPYVKSVSDYYSASDLFVLPSISETFGLVLLEAMASGLPVIASNGGACTEVLGECGLSFDSKNSKELANSILKIINNNEIYRDLQMKGLRRARQFSWEKAADQYFSLYKSIIKKKSEI